ncbi:hypothetical protein [Rhodococcus tibetensis]|uniref:Uncharacterized protein n=1 Tax=Rhodococcus tibetensis TaxID=2965064 RepID=A0ABT1Q853_9NOCA|nr:hypothetical protein [Rhodococcus sp. FXJ9.536]MCQ4118430.1 hypothetical protein [Rhodococcus sp. FXJ9.536]
MFQRIPMQRAVDTALKKKPVPLDTPTHVWGPLFADKRATIGRMRLITLIAAAMIWLMHYRSRSTITAARSTGLSRNSDPART